jgi:hypothetical protein
MNIEVSDTSYVMYTRSICRCLVFRSSQRAYNAVIVR